jgi:hypothetical protein
MQLIPLILTQNQILTLVPSDAGIGETAQHLLKNFRDIILYFNELKI